MMRQTLKSFRRASLWLAGTFAAFTLAACDDATPDYRYRLTVEVETPEGLRTGSSVIEVEQSMGRSSMAPASNQIYRRIRGEAVAVELPGGQTLFALLRSESNIEWAETIAASAAPPAEESEDGEPRFDNMLALEGAAELPRTFPASGWLEERSAYPMLVTFGDIDDPSSVREVDPDDLAATFGAGYALERITVEITDDRVTTGIEERLGWFGPSEPNIGALKPSGSRFLKDAEPINLVTSSDFRTGFYK
ncbi:MAG: hypothetical protein WA936_05390 [Erythrobacter sp.]